MTGTFFSSLIDVFEPTTLMLMLVGIGIGFVVGILPGLGGSVTLALMIPFIYDMEPVQGCAFLLGMWVVCATTGDITSVLFGVPGEPTSAAVVLDGFPMTRRGEAGRALGAVLFSSSVGALIGALVLAVSVPVVRPVILAFGPPELFMLTLLGLAFVISLSNGQTIRGLVMACLGLLVSLVGIDSQVGIPRLTFDQLYLWDGIDIIPVVVGLFGGAELLQLMLGRSTITADQSGPLDTGQVRRGVADTIRHWRVVLQSSLIGVGFGIIPGIGGAVSQFIAYGQAKQISRHPEEFGKGSIEGVIAAGACNNAKDSGSLIPTLAFGVPGGAGSAILLSAFLILGINPGKEMLTTNVNLTFSMVWIVVVSNLIAVAAALLLVRRLASLTRVNGSWLVPFILLLLVLGAFAASNSYADIIVMFASAALGVAAIRWDWPRVPFLLGVILGSLAERYLFMSYSLHGWVWLGDTGPIAIGILCVLVLTVPAVRKLVRDRRSNLDPATTGTKGGIR